MNQKEELARFGEIHLRNGFLNLYLRKGFLKPMAAQEDTLRDRFAMAALTGLIANDEEAIAKAAYRLADAMLKARIARPAGEERP